MGEEMKGNDRVHTIVVIDDEDEICRALTRLLTMEGYRVSAAGSGQEGLDLARRSDPTLVFVDLSLPDISGWEVVQMIKKVNGQVKVVLMTGWSSRLVEAEAGEGSVDIILCKPFDFDDVLEAMASLAAGE